MKTLVAKLLGLFKKTPESVPVGKLDALNFDNFTLFIWTGEYKKFPDDPKHGDYCLMKEQNEVYLYTQDRWYLCT